MSDNVLTELEKAIDIQKRYCKTLSSDIENPRNLNAEIDRAVEKCQKLPAQLKAEVDAAETQLRYLPSALDNEIEAARKRLETLTATRQEKINAATRHVAELRETMPGKLREAAEYRDGLRYRRDNLRSIYATEFEKLIAMQKRATKLRNSAQLLKLQELQRQFAELQKSLPENLRSAPMEEIQKMLEGQSDV